MSDLGKHLISQYLPYLIAFLLGVIFAWKGCGDTSGKPINTVIEKPVPVIEYVDRWKYDTLRFVRWNTVYDTVHDTVHDVEYVNIYDSVLVIDTVKIIESWLTEVTKYDTTALDGQLHLRWQNYQNLTENLIIDYTPKKINSNFSVGLHAKVGLVSDFKMQYTPMIGAGIGFKIKNNYLTADYGYLQQHYVGVTYGRYLLNF